MEQLYTHPFYKEHLQKRGNLQSIMLGFSDSTKDGGYLMANWSIYKAKVELTAMARKYGIDLAFFDGRGDYLRVAEVKHIVFTPRWGRRLPMIISN